MSHADGAFRGRVRCPFQTTHLSLVGLARQVVFFVRVTALVLGPHLLPGLHDLSQPSSATTGTSFLGGICCIVTMKKTDQDGAFNELALLLQMTKRSFPRKGLHVDNRAI